jgi:hypothetical protein
MKKHISADYDPETKTITVLDPLEGVRDAEEVSVRLTRNAASTSRDETRGLLRGEAGDELAALVEEMFPTEK